MASRAEECEEFAGRLCKDWPREDFDGGGCEAPSYSSSGWLGRRRFKERSLGFARDGKGAMGRNSSAPEEALRLLSEDESFGGVNCAFFFFDTARGGAGESPSSEWAAGE
jgi:hypothetical protein